MIYLIGGSPRCGKTILSKKVSTKTKSSYISTDSLRPMVLTMIPKADIKKRFPQTGMPTPKDKFRFDIYTAQEMRKAQVIEAKTMWPATKAFIHSLIYREQDCVIEGVHLLPALVNQLKKTDLWKHIKVVYLVKTDLEKIKKGFAKNSGGFDWMYPAIKDNDERLTKAAQMVAEKSIYIKKSAETYNFKTYNTEDDFSKVIKEAQQYLLG